MANTPHRIIEMVDGKPRTRLVSDEELRRLNTPKESARPGKYDADISRYGSRFGIKNRIFGSK